eukprot:scaffold10772_cov107-Isochrysis_galbana.AAC.1
MKMEKTADADATDAPPLKPPLEFGEGARFPPNSPKSKFTKKSHPGRGTSNDAAVQAWHSGPPTARASHRI